MTQNVRHRGKSFRRSHPIFEPLKVNQKNLYNIYVRWDLSKYSNNAHKEEFLVNCFLQCI